MMNNKQSLSKLSWGGYKLIDLKELLDIGVSGDSQILFTRFCSQRDYLLCFVNLHLNADPPSSGVFGVHVELEHSALLLIG